MLAVMFTFIVDGAKACLKCLLTRWWLWWYFISNVVSLEYYVYMYVCALWHKAIFDKIYSAHTVNALIFAGSK